MAVARKGLDIPQCLPEFIVFHMSCCGYWLAANCEGMYDCVNWDEGELNGLLRGVAVVVACVAVLKSFVQSS